MMRLAANLFRSTSAGVWSLAAVVMLSAAVLPESPVAAIDDTDPTLAELAKVFPSADRAEPMEGSPPAAAAYRDGDLIGYVFSTAATVGSVGYSGKPLDVLAGVDRNARISGALLRRHNEPILVIGVSDDDLARFVDGFAGFNLAGRPTEMKTRRDEAGLPDVIAGATVSSGVIREAVLRAGRAVAYSRGLMASATSATARLDRESFEAASWQDLTGDGSIVGRLITEDDAAPATGTSDQRVKGNAPYIELFVALATSPRVGQNLLGRRTYERIIAETDPNDQVVFIAARGRYSFKGTAWVRSGRFDRIQIVQGQTTIPLTTRGYANVERSAVEGAPELREAGVFTVPAETGFDPLRPWRLDLLLPADAGAQPAVVSVDYVLPGRYRLAGTANAASTLTDAAETATAAPRWEEAWREDWARTVLVVLLLTALTSILVLQDKIAGNRVLHRRIRLAFLTVTLVWLGWIAGGQLSVVNVLTFAHALMSEFRWEYFLLDPVIFLLWSYVALALLFWGRGVFCGWLCPFGALQELTHEVARKLRVPQVRLPFILHERLWPLKYILFIGLFAVSLNSINQAFVFAEVEPFKTAISMRFVRHWPFVLYAGALLVAGLFVERFFCRYLCPLGAALAIPARLRMFEWLKRHPQCGRECAICEHSCPVQAIHPSGAINPNECIYCLQCQTLYYDEFTCPPMVHRRKRRERRDMLAAGQSITMEKHRDADA
jgi:transcriptional regulator of nitric oxide reductase